MCEPVASPRRFVSTFPSRLGLSKCGCRSGSPTAEVHAQACHVPVCINSAEVLGHEVRWVGKTRDLEELEVPLPDLILEPQIANDQLPELAGPGPPDDPYDSAGICVQWR